VTIKQNLFLEIQGEKKKTKEGKIVGTTDLTIIPFEIELTAHLGFRDSYNAKFGSVPLIALRRIGYEQN
jgi:hypothetical protein